MQDVKMIVSPSVAVQQEKCEKGCASMSVEDSRALAIRFITTMREHNGSVPRAMTMGSGVLGKFGRRK